jgi:hypothetical protein
MVFHIFAEAVTNKKDIFHCDIAVVCDIINQHSSNGGSVMDLGRPL